MTRFEQWLEEQNGRATKLAETLGVTRNYVSAVKKGKSRMPPYWMPIINQITRIPLKVLLEENGSKPPRK